MTSVARPGGERERRRMSEDFPEPSQSPEISQTLEDIRTSEISGPGHRSVSTPVTYSESQSGGNNPGKVLNCNPGHF